MEKKAVVSVVGLILVWAPALFAGVVAGESVVARAEVLPRRSEVLGDYCWLLPLPVLAALFATIASCC